MFNFMMNRAPASNTPRLSPQEIVSRSAEGAITVIDVRDHNEIAMSGKAAGALHIPLAVLRMQADPSSPDFHPELSTDKPVAIYCATGSRSGMAVRLFSSLGFGEVHNLGGLGHWQMAGGQITR
ncbi:MAG: sulfurtransferase [Rhodobacteraceae bacterium]|nr:sulfurtransferase [Paracoccaceae bacterium]